MCCIAESEKNLCLVSELEFPHIIDQIGLWLLLQNSAPFSLLQQNPELDLTGLGEGEEPPKRKCRTTFSRQWPPATKLFRSWEIFENNFCLIIPLTLQWSFIFRNGKEHKGAAVCRFIPSRMQQCIFGSQLTEVLPGCHDAREKADPTTTHRPLSQNLKTEAKKIERIFRDATSRQDRCKLHPLKRWTIICGSEKVWTKMANPQNLISLRLFPGGKQGERGMQFWTFDTENWTKFKFKLCNIFALTRKNHFKFFKIEKRDLLLFWVFSIEISFTTSKTI